jgi:hypothetical protein
LVLHLLVPLFFGLLAQAIFVRLNGHPWTELVSFETLVLVAGVVVAYIAIMHWFIRKETSINILAEDLLVLDDALAQASSFFATSTIGMKEWFDPITQVYLASIMKRMLQPQAFRYERTLLLFARKGKGIEVLNAPYLDGYYARSLADIHRLLGIPLSFLSRSEIFDILGRLPFPQKKQVLRCSGFTEWMFDKCPALLARGYLRRLDFALLEDNTQNKVVLLVSKKKENVRISRLKNAADVEPYSLLVQQIRDRAYDATGKIGVEHDFVRVLRR